MIEVRRLRVLRELSDRGTVAAAAQALHLTPSAVSQQLAALARETGSTLVEADGRRLRLTSAGRLLLDHAHRVFAQIEQAEAALARHHAGELDVLHVGAFASGLAHLVAPAARQLRRGDPPVRVHTVEVGEADSIKRVGTGELDIAVSVEFDGAPQHDDPRYFRQELMTDALDIALPADHPDAAADELPLARLATQPWILGSPGTSCEELVRIACATAGFTPTPAHRTSDWAAVGHLVDAGLGVALVPRLVQPLMPATVRLVPTGGTHPARHVFAATRRGSESAPTLDRALHALRRCADALLPAESTPSP
ncbi:MAG TPA: LysR family transcriptional regulator [Actinocatenispora sp.]